MLYYELKSESSYWEFRKMNTNILRNNLNSIDFFSCLKYHRFTSFTHKYFPIHFHVYQ